MPCGVGQGDAERSRTVAASVSEGSVHEVLRVDKFHQYLTIRRRLLNIHCEGSRVWKPEQLKHNGMDCNPHHWFHLSPHSTFQPGHSDGLTRRFVVGAGSQRQPGSLAALAEMETLRLYSSKSQPAPPPCGNAEKLM